MISKVGETGASAPLPERTVAENLDRSARAFVHQVRYPGDLEKLASAILALAKHASEAAQC